MIVAWSLGGGLGHLTRIAAWWHTCRPTSSLVVATVSKHATDPRAVTGATIVRLADPAGRPDRRLLRRQLSGLLADPSVSELVVDAFPGGLFGELDGLRAPDHVPVTCLARALRWDAYRRRLGPRPPRFDRVHRMEALPPDQDRWLRDQADSIDDLRVHDPPPVPEPDSVEVAGSVLVVHSGPEAEIERLLGWCDRRRPVVLACPPWSVPLTVPAGTTVVDALPAWPLFGQAAQIVAGGGWNVVRQTMPMASKRVLIPFARALDDQHRRVALAQRSSSTMTGGPTARDGRIGGYRNRAAGWSPGRWTAPS
jgi:hypothetical protein